MSDIQEYTVPVKLRVGDDRASLKLLNAPHLGVMELCLTATKHIFGRVPPNGTEVDTVLHFHAPVFAPAKPPVTEQEIRSLGCNFTHLAEKLSCGTEYRQLLESFNPDQEHTFPHMNLMKRHDLTDLQTSLDNAYGFYRVTVTFNDTAETFDARSTLSFKSAFVRCWLLNQLHKVLWRS